MIKQKRVVVYIPEDQHKILKSKLALLGKTVSGWAREIISAFIREN